MHNFLILCRIWKYVNSAKYWIAIACKTVTGQYGFSIQFYRRWMISQISSVSFLVHTLLCVELWNTDSWGCGPKTVGVLGDIRGCKISLSAMQMAICQKRPNFWIPYFRPSKMPPPPQCREGRISPSLPPAATAFNDADDKLSYRLIVNKRHMLQHLLPDNVHSMAATCDLENTTKLLSSSLLKMTIAIFKIRCFIRTVIRPLINTFYLHFYLRVLSGQVVYCQLYFTQI